MRTGHAAPMAAATLLVLLAGGCSALSARYSPEQLERVGSELANADRVFAELGPADLRRDGGHLWIYAWEEPALPPNMSLLVIEFDSDGMLLNKEIAREVRPVQGGLDAYSANARFCADGGICVEHGVQTEDGRHFDDSFSAVSIDGNARARFRSPEPRAEDCLLVIWPGEAWSRSRGAVLPPNGIAVGVEGAPVWLYPRWVPAGSFARILLPAGEHVISVRDPVWDERMSDQAAVPSGFWAEVLDVLLSAPPEEFDKPPSTAPFQCRRGERAYLEIDATFESTGDHWFPIALRPVDENTAQAVIANMRQVLPPDH